MNRKAELNGSFHSHGNRRWQKLHNFNESNVRNLSGICIFNPRYEKWERFLLLRWMNVSVQKSIEFLISGCVQNECFPKKSIEMKKGLIQCEDSSYNKDWIVNRTLWADTQLVDNTITPADHTSFLSNWIPLKNIYSLHIY